MTKFPLFRQLDSKDCGPTCIQMVAKYYGKNYSLKFLREKSYITREGVSMLGLCEAAESIGFRTMGSKISWEQLRDQAQFPCIAHWKKSHFVVIYKIAAKKKLLSFFSSSPNEFWIYVADPANGFTAYKEHEFKKAWISTKLNESEVGHCMFLYPTDEFYSSNESNSNINHWFNLLSYLKPYKALISQLILSFTVASILQLIFPFLTQAIVDKAINFRDLDFLTLILIAQLSLTIGLTTTDFMRSWIMLYISTRISISFLSDFLTKLLSLPISFFDSKRAGDIMQRIGDNKRIETFLTSTLISILFAASNFIIFTIVIAYYDSLVFGIFIVGSTFYIVWVNFFLRYRRNLDNRRFTQATNNQNNVIQLVAGIQEIKLNNIEKQKRWEWERIQAMLYKIRIRTLMLSQYQQGGALLINSFKNIVITFITAKQVINGEMTLGMMLAIQYIIGQLNGPIEQMIVFIRSWQDAKISLERIGEIHEKNPEEINSSITINEFPCFKSIELNKISFHYEGPHSPAVLNNISLSIPSKKITAIVGTSGSGKTTLLKLLLGFYEPSSGEIKIGNHRLNTISKRIWRQNVGSVLQDGFLFSDTISQNITLYDENINKSRLLAAVSLANIRDFIESQPLGYNTMIGSEGSGISEGQKQRILISRVIYKNPDIIIFDEATNALDSSNERVIVQNLNKFFKDKTVIIVAHRLSTVKNADKIIVLDDGEIKEDGTHEELIKQKGAYYQLVRNQLELGT